MKIRDMTTFEGKLRRDIERGRTELRPYREKNREFCEAYAGAHYHADMKRQKTPMNYMEVVIKTYVQRLAPREPQVFVGSPIADLRPSSKSFELALNHLLKHEIKFGKTLRRWVLRSLFSIGILKVGLRHAGDIELDGDTYEYGQPFASIVELDDFVVDPMATDWDNIRFIGNQYRVKLETVKNNPYFNKAARENVTADERSDLNEDGDERTESIGGEDIITESSDDMAWLYDIFLPSEKRFITMAKNGTGFLRSVEWDGPESGPYHPLFYSEVPGNLMPLPFVSQIVDMNDLINRLWRKTGRQAEREKTLLGYAGSAIEDAKAILNANDGEAIRMDRPDNVREYRFGGANPQTIGLMMQAKQELSWQAGNLDSLAGLSPQAETVGQEQLLKASSSMIIESMSSIVMEATEKVIRDLGFYLWHDPLIEFPLTKRVEGTDIEIPVTFSQEEREGDFYEYNIEINPYSMQSQSPSQKVNTLMQMLQGVILPMMPFLQEQGMSLNMPALLAKLSEYTNLDELEELLVTEDGPVRFPRPDTSRVGQPPQKAPFTQRTEIRRNIPGASRGGQDQVMQQLFAKMGGPGSNPNQAASAARPVG